MQYIDNIIFLILLVAGFGLFAKSLQKIYRNIRLGHEIKRNDRQSERWSTMARVAMGQSKMVKRPVAGILHVFVYVGFIIINIELVEIIVDGLFGTHRFLASVFGESFYSFFTATLEVLALLVVIGVVVFFIRRNFYGVKRLTMKELFGWPKHDANWILIIEFALMMAFFKMNAADWVLQQRGLLHELGSFPISSAILGPIFNNFSDGFLFFTEKGAWWFHFVGILFFMNYLYYSKHLHIILAFPSTWYANLDKKGKFNNLDSVTKEIKLMMDPNADPYAAPAEGEAEAAPSKFGAEDIFDLNQVQLLNAYSCTECGRCTSVCPANITGKKLSPRLILMKTRDRLEEVGRNIDKNGKFVDDGKKLLNDYITKEELWACTTCNACTEACPVLLDPLSIIFEMRRFLVMEQSAAPQELNLMMTNVENNAAPWQYNQADRLNWATEN
ncbi:(Fe-S)-binding protein [Chryseobacterium indologenes]|uniref:(Fe-S)-binding protein n=1 Tax=Chryseobacterium indologenes TaxID=253 RepID=A0A1Z3W5N8_CHRID|nr:MULTISPECIES: (Fe-S)-binding protein [Chryseobacterium]ASE63073.1 (Fe-S)-binding protein [Chryseobacterium indologenes]ATN06979.1 (Fe-S)-binding protein [Chryseobacterium indologenes]AYY84275.1 (Fe-S)-binding protein [Chryseobacterium indologenes]AYZ38017.1 (Fe-S)-binding protein [Chryseobacterium indologenes]AZB18767.1 (Fe-S)-binding protein [Chryseobacterium indologenes]